MDKTAQTEATLNHHIQAAVAGDLDGILSDYTEDSVIYSQSGPARGLAGIREFFGEFLKNKPPGFPEDVEMLRQDVEGEVAYIVWKCGDALPLATDTLLVRDGKIKAQTFTAFTS